LIGDVSADTPGSRAGLKRGDVVLELNGAPVKDASQLRLQISQTAPGTVVRLRIWRDGKAQDVSVTLGELPEKSAGAGGGSESGGGALQGVEVQALTPDIAQQLNVSPGTRGVVVTSVDPSSAAAAAGVDRGDIIQEVNHKPVTNVREYGQALADAGNQPVLLLINENGVTRYVVVETQ
jgi:serine protease Do